MEARRQMHTSSNSSKSIGRFAGKARQVGHVLDVLSPARKQRRKAYRLAGRRDEISQDVAFAAALMGGDQRQDEKRGIGKNDSAGGWGGNRRRCFILATRPRMAGFGEVRKSRAVQGGGGRRGRLCAWGNSLGGLRSGERGSETWHQAAGETGAGKARATIGKNGIGQALRHAATSQWSAR